ncbi:hypothetical protein FN846DRAFT_934078 [Sphaerosporella brunnea]|uniref:Uncharacterized protein n=1 Tax=Sphaerosporella brunnea TaxID=1250544 RepID=A0A5J5F6A3_9PEZI|nr:hypothetical protein FN846DRAFT_934078 [Sphaerosporella brunnea]
MPSCLTFDDDRDNRRHTLVDGGKRAAYVITGMQRLAPGSMADGPLPPTLKERCSKLWKRLRGRKEEVAAAPANTPAPETETAAMPAPAQREEATDAASDSEADEEVFYTGRTVPTPAPTLSALNIVDSSLDLTALAAVEAAPPPPAPTPQKKDSAEAPTSRPSSADQDGFRPSVRNRRLSTDPAVRFREIAAEWKKIAPAESVARRDSTIRLVTTESELQAKPFRHPDTAKHDSAVDISQQKTGGGGALGV